MKNIFGILLLSIAVCGCKNINPQVQCIHTWEGHFKTTNEFYEATKNIQLEKKETVWVLSNDTLKRVLENVAK